MANIDHAYIVQYHTLDLINILYVCVCGVRKYSKSYLSDDTDGEASQHMYTSHCHCNNIISISLELPCSMFQFRSSSMHLSKILAGWDTQTLAPCTCS